MKSYVEKLCKIFVAQRNVGDENVLTVPGPAGAIGFLKDAKVAMPLYSDAMKLVMM